MLLGRLAASRILLKSSAIHIILAAGILITLTTFTLLQLNSPATVTLAVFAAGFCMAPVFPTVLALVSGLFRQGTATAMGIAITCGWLGLAVSSPIIGALAEKTRLGYALLLLPVSGILMVLVTLVLKARLRLAPVT
jgi:fucose permease